MLTETPRAVRGGVPECVSPGMVTFPVFYFYPKYLPFPNAAWVKHTHTALNHPAFSCDFISLTLKYLTIVVFFPSYELLCFVVNSELLACI